MKGKLISNKKLANLPQGTKLLIHCFDEDFWLVCTVEHESSKWNYLKDIDTKANLTYIDDVAELNKFMKAYEYNEDDAKEYVKKVIYYEDEVEAEEVKVPEYIVTWKTWDGNRYFYTKSKEEAYKVFKDAKNTYRHVKLYEAELIECYEHKDEQEE